MAAGPREPREAGRKADEAEPGEEAALRKVARPGGPIESGLPEMGERGTGEMR